MQIGCLLLAAFLTGSTAGAADHCKYGFEVKRNITFLKSWEERLSAHPEERRVACPWLTKVEIPFLRRYASYMLSIANSEEATKGLVQGDPRYAYDYLENVTNAMGNKVGELVEVLSNGCRDGDPAPNDSLISRTSQSANEALSLIGPGVGPHYYADRTIGGMGNALLELFKCEQ
jgi:hypothetical protein